MSSGPSLKPMPTYRPGDTYSQENERRSRAGFSRELEQKHDKRSDLRVGQGFDLVLTSPGFIDYAIGFDDNGLLTVTNYDTGVSGTFVIDWQDVQGLEQELLDLQSSFEAADTILQAGITSNAGLITTNTSSIATINTELLAARDGEANLLAKITSVETTATDAETAAATAQSEITAARDGELSLLAQINGIQQSVVDEASARAIAIEEVKAEVQASWPNLIPPEYRYPKEGDDALWQIIFADIGATGVPQPLRPEQDALKIEADGTQSQLLARMRPAVTGLTNLILPPGRYGLRIGYRAEGNGVTITGLNARLRDTTEAFPSGRNEAFSPLVSGGTTNEATCVFDLTSESVSEYFLELHVAFASASSLPDFYIHALRLEALPDGLTEPGPFVGDAEQAIASSVREAIIGADGQAVARIILEAAAGSGQPTRIGLQRGSDGSSDIALVAKQIFFGSDTVFEDTSDTIYVETGGFRQRILGPFGASNDLVWWYGPTSVALNSETRTNGIWAFGTDGKVYYGSAELGAGEFTVSTGRPYLNAEVAGSGAGTATTLIPLTSSSNAVGSVAHEWRRKSGDTSSTVSNSTIPNPTFSRAMGPRDTTEDYQTVWTLIATDDDGNIATTDVITQFTNVF